MELVPFPPRHKPVPEHLREIAGELGRVLSQHPEVAAAYVFGWVGRGDATPGSDLDVGIVCAQRGDTAREHVDLIGTLAAEIEVVSAT
jgi:predicted nucleotidyltransferase